MDKYNDSALELHFGCFFLDYQCYDCYRKGTAGLSYNQVSWIALLFSDYQYIDRQKHLSRPVCFSSLSFREPMNSSTAAMMP